MGREKHKVVLGGGGKEAALLSDRTLFKKERKRVDGEWVKQERDPFTDLRRLLQSSDLTLTGMLSDLD